VKARASARLIIPFGLLAGPVAEAWAVSTPTVKRKLTGAANRVTLCQHRKIPQRNGGLGNPPYPCRIGTYRGGLSCYGFWRADHPVLSLPAEPRWRGVSGRRLGVFGWTDGTGSIPSLGWNLGQRLFDERDVSRWTNSRPGRAAARDCPGRRRRRTCGSWPGRPQLARCCPWPPRGRDTPSPARRGRVAVPDGTGGSGRLLLVIRAGRAGSRRRAAGP
jgi:hypothetical protein